MARPRKPTALKLLKGTLQPCRTNKAEPKPQVFDVLPMPSHLPDTWAPSWEYIARSAAHLRCTTLADVPAMQAIVGVYREVEKLSKSRQSTVKARKVLFDMLGKFGMTPSERSKVSALPEKEQDTLDEFAAAAE